MVTVECIIPQEHYRTVLSTRGSKMQNIQRQFNVTIELPDLEKSEDADNVTMNGDVYAEDLKDDFPANFEAERDELRKHMKQQIFKIQDKNRTT
ncbi:hypothetical protein NPIL_70921 [Nephila pilipes]|uniref:K Homology domain-containing protein n=1 Tax=Nephila pilipes TaxID=299642 RepID=A0A8X6P4J2_NEPPI|nr:hypothetical protein NPIL_70921 [Nephila pilipes]